MHTRPVLSGVCRLVAPVIAFKWRDLWILVAKDSTQVNYISFKPDRNQYNP